MLLSPSNMKLVINHINKDTDAFHLHFYLLIVSQNVFDNIKKYINA